MLYQICANCTFADGGCSLFVAVLVDNFQLTLYAAHGEAKDKKMVKLDEEDDTLSGCELLCDRHY